MALLSVILVNAIYLGISMLILFAFIKAAVKSAIEDKMDRIKIALQPDDGTATIDDLIKLRDFEVLNDDELENAIETIQGDNEKKENFAAYNKYSQVLAELKSLEAFSEEQYAEKCNVLKQHFQID